MFERFVVRSLFSVAFAPKIKMRTLKTFIDVFKKAKIIVLSFRYELDDVHLQTRY